MFLSYPSCQHGAMAAAWSGGDLSAQAEEDQAWAEAWDWLSFMTFFIMLPTALQSDMTTASGRFHAVRMRSLSRYSLPHDETPFGAKYAA